MLFKGLRQDIAAIRERDPAARNALEVLLLYSGLHALMLHRPAHWLYRHRLFFPARLLSQLARFLTGVEIHPGAQMGRGILIDHGSGVVIGETAVVGDGCTIYQGVTLGGTGKEKGKRHPTLGKNVLVGAGARILGPFEVGDNCKVAANAVLLEPLKENSTAVGVPARAVRVAGKRVDANQLDQVHIPDPVAQELCRLRMQIEQLESKIKRLEEEKNEDL
ncbi:MAG: serine O-acetyltransferase [Provencibacterium sp.]|nr:serine O-acetyltransferase [Provencibacterium sp.]